MKFRALVVTVLLAAGGLVGPGIATSYADSGHDLRSARSCTTTSSGKCIRGGQFCPKSKYGKSGYDAKGRRYVCKGDRSHPHWMK